MTVIYLTNKKDWYETNLAKQELKFFKAQNDNIRFKEAIEKEEDLIRSFMESLKDRAA